MVLCEEKAGIPSESNFASGRKFLNLVVQNLQIPKIVSQGIPVFSTHTLPSTLPNPYHLYLHDPTLMPHSDHNNYPQNITRRKRQAK